MIKKIHLPRSFFSSALFLFLIPINFLLEKYTQARGAVDIITFIFCLFLYWIGILLFSIGFWRIFRDDLKAHLMTSFLLLCNCYFGPVKEYLEDVSSNGLVSRYSFLFSILFIALISLFYYLYRSSAINLKIGKWLTISILFLTVISAIRILTPPSKIADSRSLSFQPFSTSMSHPDIYIIVTDGYAGKEELNKVMDFDNNPFYDSLRQRGFWVADSSRSNYRFTPFSIVSTFSMDYFPVNKFGPREIIEAKNRIPNAAFFKLLVSNGYLLKNYSIFDDKKNKNDETIDAFEYNSFQVFFYGTLLQHISSLIDAYIFKKADLLEIDYTTAIKIKKSNDYVIRALKKESLQKDKFPKVIYSHVLAPHFPYLADSTGNYYSEEKSRSISRFSTKHYINYLKGWNRIFLSTIDSIQANTNKSAVILFFSDHGFRQFDKPKYFENYYTNLLSVYMPGQKFDKFYEGMSNVNYLRSFLNQQFDQQLPTLKDSMVTFPNNGVRLKKN